MTAKREKRMLQGHRKEMKRHNRKMLIVHGHSKAAKKRSLD